MKNFCIISNCLKDKDNKATKKITDMIESRGGKVLVISKGLKEQDLEHTMAVEMIKDTSFNIECAIVLGGDGTMLQASKDLYKYDIPIIGINLGTMGFLTEIEYDNMDKAVTALLEDDYSVQSRVMLTGKVYDSTECTFKDIALNDIVVGRYGLSRVMSLEVFVNDELLNVYHGDGILVTTPTGTTGYNLSAGGPIAKPDADLLMITPICVHSLYSRSIIVSPNDVIRIRIKEERKPQLTEAIATFDGRAGYKLKENDEIVISKSDKVTKFIKLGEKRFFDIVREKIEMK